METGERLHTFGV